MFTREMRWTKEQAQTTGDGVDLRTLDLNVSDTTGMQVAADPAAIGLVRAWKAGTGFDKLSKKLISSAAGIAMITVPELNMGNALTAGVAVQRLWLDATLHDLAVHPISAPIFMGVHHLFDTHGTLGAAENVRLAEILKELSEVFDLRNDKPFFMVRLDHAPPPTVRSLRKPLASVFRY